MQSGADTLVTSEAQVLEFEEQLQQMELLVNLKKVADPLLGYAETALNNARKALDEAEPEDEEYTELRDAPAEGAGWLRQHQRTAAGLSGTAGRRQTADVPAGADFFPHAGQ